MLTMKNVALIHCDTYERQQVQESIDAIFDLCGGIDQFIKPGMRVMIKLNLLMKRTPDRATTTHPEVAYAIACAVKRAGGIPVFADSPGGPFTKGMLSGVYDTCGISAVATETDCILNDDFSVMQRYFEAGVVARKLDLIGALEHVDALITVGKLKTHGYTTMTGCVKNLYGLVPGTTKVEYHARYPKVDTFSNMLVDICEYVKPCFAILDAVEGMEGEGPSGGKPRKIGALIGGVNAHAVDCVGAELIGLTCEQVPTLKAASKRNLIGEFEVVGDSKEPLMISDFDIPMKLNKSNWLNLMDKIPQSLRPRPVFTHQKCDGCGTCARVCPGKAITMDEHRRPLVDLQACIRCFCCQELCPHTDIEVKRNWLVKWLK